MSDATRAEIEVDTGLARSLTEQGFAAHPGDRILVTFATRGPATGRSRLRNVLRRVFARVVPKSSVPDKRAAADDPGISDDLPSFARGFAGPPDLAARSKEILRAELGR